MSAVVDRNECTGCGACVDVCPVEAIKLDDGIAVVDEDTCTECGLCEDACPVGAIKVER